MKELVFYHDEKEKYGAWGKMRCRRNFAGVGYAFFPTGISTHSDRDLIAFRSALNAVDMGSHFCVFGSAFFPIGISSRSDRDLNVVDMGSHFFVWVQRISCMGMSCGSTGREGSF